MVVILMHKKKIFYIGDPHLYSKSVIKKSNRPFKDEIEMTETILQNWRRTVSPWDEVRVIGDLCKYNLPGGKLRQIFRELPGEKHLILGNHDMMYKYKKDMMSCFKTVKKYDKIVDNGRHVVLFHYPLEVWDGMFYQDAYHIHAHVHGGILPGNEECLKDIPRRFNASADSLGFTPRTLDEIISYQKNI